MTLIDELKQKGWYLTESGLRQVTETLDSKSAANLHNVINAILDHDFREIAAGALPAKRGSIIDGKIVLQIQKIRNIAAPKANESSKVAPRFLQVELTDGQSSLFGLELEPLSTISQNTPPGTKVFLKADKLHVMQGYVALFAADVQVLGGRVQSLIEKWEITRNMQNYAQSERHASGANGPPAWLSFGAKLQVSENLSGGGGNFKSLQLPTEKEKSDKGNVEDFNIMRNEAIAEAAKLGVKKIFGGGGQQIVDHNMKKILAKGYSEHEAREVLRATNNNLERALHQLKRYSQQEPTKKTTPSFATNSKRRNDKEEIISSRPADNVSLFDFLTSKLPETPAAAVSAANENVTKTTGFVRKTTPDYERNSFKTSAKYENGSSKSSTNQQHAKNEHNNIRPSYESKERGGADRNRSNFNVISDSKNDAKTSQHQHFKNQSSANLKNGKRNNSEDVENKNSNSNSLGSAYYKATTTTAAKQQQHPDNRDTKSNARNDNANRNGDRNRRNFNAMTDSKYDSKTQQQQNMKNYYSANLKNGNRNNAEELDDKKHNSKYAENQNSKKQATDAASIKPRNNDKYRNSLSMNRDGPSKNYNQASTSKIVENKYPNKASENHQNDKNQKNFQTMLEKPITYPTFVKSASEQHKNQYTSNALTDNSSKIMGFQNKQSNDLAMNMLLSQGIDVATSAMSNLCISNSMPQSQSQVQNKQKRLQHEPYPNKNSNVNTAAHNSKSLTAKDASNTSVYAANPQNAVTQNNYEFSKPFMGSLNTNHQGVNQPFMWSPGDSCFAKYWDDGQFYAAKVTAVSLNTLVVFFTDYGNYEEVLKTDCVPMSIVNNVPSPMNTGHVYSDFALPQMQHMGPGISNNAMNTNAVPQRFRTADRKVYVPPPKRTNNQN